MHRKMPGWFGGELRGEKDLFSRHLAAQLTQFSIDLRAGTVTCPAGQATSDARRAKDHKGRPATVFYFDAATCGICPLRERCTAGKGRAHHHGRPSPPPHRGGLGRPGRAGHEGIVAQKGQSGAEDVRHESPGCIPGIAGRNPGGGSWLRWLTWTRKGKGDKSMPGNHRSRPDVWDGAVGGPA